jgi:hypothetical protein
VGDRVRTTGIFLSHQQEVTLLWNVLFLMVLAFLVGFAIGEWREAKFHHDLERKSK